jgi:hypothetical protein
VLSLSDVTALNDKVMAQFLGQHITLLAADSTVDDVNARPGESHESTNRIPQLY